MESKPTPIRLIHVSDVHLGSGESHGRINPESGLNIRFEDFVKAFASAVDFAIESESDIFLFSGDAYRNASPESLYQKAFAEQLHRLSQADIKTILLVGNHDQILKSSASHSMSVFQSLAVPNVTTIDGPLFLRVDTKHGACQIVGIPHVTRHMLVSHEKYANLPAGEIDKLMVSSVQDILRELYDQLDPQLPSVATAHMMVDSARAGAELELMVGYSMSFPLSLFVDERLDYVALGHVHGYQILRQKQPAIVYAGSVERVDFGEEHEDKGFVEVELLRNATKFKFHSINPRPFVTVEADLTTSSQPGEELASLIRAKVTPGCVARVKFNITEQQAATLDQQILREAAEEAMSVQFKPEIAHIQREVRMPQLTESSVIAPLAALATYLDQVAPQRKDVLLNKAEELCRKLQAEE